MTLFQILNIIIGLLAAAIVGYGVWLYLKKRNENLSTRQIAIWFLSFLATFCIAFGLASIFLLTPFNEWALSSAVNRIPIIPAIKEYHPKLYEELMQKAKGSVKKQEAPESFVAYSLIYVNQVFINDLKNAPDDAIYEYVLQVKQFYDILSQHDPKLVIRMEKADVSIIKDLPTLSKDPDFKLALDKMVDAKKNVIAQAIKNPSAPPPESTVRPIFNSLMIKLNDKYGAQVVNDTFSFTKSDVPAEIESKVIIDFYREIVNMNKSNVGALMRYIASISAKQNPT